MLHTIKTKFITLLCLVSLMSGCSIAGSWLYDRLDDYINDYFFNFANFSNDCWNEILAHSEDIGECAEFKSL